MRLRFNLSLVGVLLLSLFVFANSHRVVNAAVPVTMCDAINGDKYGPLLLFSGYSGPAFDIGDTLTITHTGTATHVSVELPAGTPVATIPQGGKVTITVTIAGTSSLLIRNLTGSGDIEGLITCVGASSVSDDPDVEVLFEPGDGRINHHVADRAAPAAVYCQYEGVQIIRIDPVTAEGTDEIRLTAAEIEAAGIPSEGNVILAQTDWAIVARLADGRFSLNAWYADGKPYIIIWGECSLDDIEYIAR